MISTREAFPLMGVAVMVQSELVRHRALHEDRLWL